MVEREALAYLHIRSDGFLDLLVMRQHVVKDVHELSCQEDGVVEAVGQDEAQAPLKAGVRQDAGVQKGTQEGLPF